LRLQRQQRARHRHHEDDQAGGHAGGQWIQNRIDRSFIRVE
jgi:hypothetical protein